MIKDIQVTIGPPNGYVENITYNLTHPGYPEQIASLSEFDLEVFDAYLTVLKRTVKSEKQKRKAANDFRLSGSDRGVHKDTI